MKNIVLAISGCSGVGKGTIVKKLIERNQDIVTSVSCTTRLPREGEQNGREYFFLTREQFEKRIKNNEFLEYDEHFGNYYGTPKTFVQEKLKTVSVILEIDVKGAMNAKNCLPESVLIFIAPPSEEILISRLKGRGTESQEEIENRIARAQYELSFQNQYDYVVINDDLQKAVEEIEKIIQTEKNKN